MGIQVALHHRTRYRYGHAVSLGPQIIQLHPAPHCRTPVSGYSLEIAPADRVLHWQFDSLGNRVARVLLPSRTDEFAIDVSLTADLIPRNPFDFFLDPGFESYPFTYPLEVAANLAIYRLAEPPGPRMQAFLYGLPAGNGTVDLLVRLNGQVREAVGYVTRLEHGVQSCEETLAAGTGSCRDSAWLLVQVLRHFGFAARFVSGYLIQLASDDPGSDSGDDLGDRTGGETARTTDSADLHAWAEAFLPGAGWIGLDATSGLLAAEGHIPLACAPTASEAAPVGGTVEPARVDFSYSLTVQRLGEAPSTAQPFTDEEWTRVRDVAHRIDADLLRDDIRLTMGGEPTYVAVDGPEGPQWNIEALGPEKRSRGLALLRDLRARTAPGALLHFGQGKWYPGETLPRWAFHCISRTDGVPVWEDGDLIAREEQVLGFGVSDSLRFLEALTRRLGVSRENVLPGFNPDDGSNEATEPAGYILPLRRRQPEGRLAWSSQLWFPRPERLLLSFGDSPIGYRIPVEPMPFVAPDELVYERDTSEEQDTGEHETGPDGKALGRLKIPAQPERRPDLFGVEPAPDPLPPLAGNAAAATELIRPALCVEAREGRLCVFLPYVPALPDYLDLIAAVEDTCRHLGTPVWVEGYTPPADPRLRSFSLTPDPGVLEVNLPPTSNWDDLETLNEILAEEAERNRLIAGKFAYDGSHLATGGGSHIVLGAATVRDSPILRRPDLLRSMVGFWQNHPSLSYLFSGMYVGPTSQYPRVDEARADALYELEVAFSQLPAGGCPPEIVDGLFRNLLVDVTGNTHRAEFCIDKLYPPEFQGLRAGLLELRAFEMPPHFRMGLLEMLLVRALVCLFWKQPFTGGLVRWGADLHDRFMLPHFVEEDFRAVLGALRAAGYPLEAKWFAAHGEFRFPRIGSMEAGGIHVELRQALEPWNVLAEETNSGRTGRSVDSSLERMQVSVTGMPADGLTLLLCNGRRVPLLAVGGAEEASNRQAIASPASSPQASTSQVLAGIRYRARKLSAALHPTVPVHTPLVFDLLDTRTSRSVARCTYFAGPPDGTVHTARPANAAEARARRRERFVVSAPPSEAIPIPQAEHNPVFPMTLDLRWPAPGAIPSHVPERPVEPTP